MGGFPLAKKTHKEDKTGGREPSALSGFGPEAQTSPELVSRNIRPSVPESPKECAQVSGQSPNMESPT